MQPNQKSVLEDSTSRPDGYLFTDDSIDLPVVDPVWWTVLPKITDGFGGTPCFSCAVGNGMSNSGILHGDLLAMDPEGPYRGGDLVGAVIGGVSRLRRLIIVRRIPHLIRDNPPELLLAIDISFVGILRCVFRVAGTSEARRWTKPPRQRPTPPAVTTLQTKTIR